MARSVKDVAVALGAMTGIDPADAATQKSEGKFSTDYTKDLKVDALKGARIGIARDFLGADPDVDWVIEASLAAMRNSGATIVDVRFPKWLLDSKLEFYNAIRMPEFAAQIKDYLATIGPEYPKTIQEMIDQTNRFTGPRADRARPNPSRWTLFKREASSGTLEDYRYTSVRDYGLPLVRAAVEGLVAAEKLDAIVYPTATRRLALLTAPPDTAPASPTASATNIANLTGFPDLIVPPGFTGDLGHFLLRPRIQRAKAFVSRIQLRTGNTRPSSAGTRACGRGEIDISALTGRLRGAVPERAPARRSDRDVEACADQRSEWQVTRPAWRGARPARPGTDNTIGRHRGRTPGDRHCRVDCGSASAVGNEAPRGFLPVPFSMLWRRNCPRNCCCRSCRTDDRSCRSSSRFRRSRRRLTLVKDSAGLPCCSRIQSLDC
jgi:hypothetical protein